MAKRTPKPAGGKPAAKGRKATPRKPPSTAVRPSGAATKPSGAVYQVKIALDEVRPPVWRRVLVKDVSLAALHDVIQIGMGWEDYHLHVFEIGEERYGNLDQWGDDPWGEHDMADERKVKLSRLIDGGVKKFRYEYDMGDGWRHTIQVEKTLPAEAGVDYPRCVDGKRACPPEDCGGPWGYGDFLDALQNPRNPRHEELREWVGGDFDAEAFDPESVNAQLAGVR